ncbi:MAG TPA: pitrilysin family protein [Myxococcota bacterium]|nr:pitrilysin family protein [Myxococcota bacterium]
MRAHGLRLAAPLALAAWLAASSVRASPAIDDSALRTRRTTLENGMVVLTLEDRTTPVVAVQMWVRVGSSDEARVTGLAHLFEHMMFNGSKRIAPERHGQLIHSRGGETNAYTTPDVTVYTTEIPREALPLVIALEAERLAHLDISEQALAKERRVVLEERLLRTEDQPGGRAREALNALMFQALPYRWPVIGWRSDIENTTVEDCREFFSTYYAPNNIVLVIVGDFDGDAALAQIRESFGALRPASRIPRSLTREPPQDGARRADVHFDLSSPVLAIAWRTPAAGHPDAEALDVAGEILSGGRSSRIYRRLIREEQLALSAHSMNWALARAGFFGAYASVRHDASIDRAEQSLLEEIARLRDAPVSAHELDTAKRQIEVAMVYELTTNAAIADRIGYDVTTFGAIRPLEERLAAIEAVAAADVQRVAQTYLGESARNVVRVVPRPGAAPAEASAPTAGGR